MNNSTLEKVARAIYEAASPVTPWVKAGEAPKRYYLSLARAALQSLRQVDDKTLGRIAYGMSLQPEDSECMSEARIAWTAAIDHILTEGGGGGEL